MFQNLLENFDDIVMTAGSGGTAAGIAIANYLTGSKLKWVVNISFQKLSILPSKKGFLVWTTSPLRRFQFSFIFLFKKLSFSFYSTPMGYIFSLQMCTRPNLTPRAYL